MRYRVRNWSEYQHYKDRNPPWIKLHYSMLSSEDWVLLDDRSRVLAIACMLIASRNNGEVPGNPEYLKRVAYLNTKPNFKPLIECGFLEVASGCKQMLADARPETETETETETDLARVRAEPKQSAKKPDMLFEAIAAACGIDWKALTKNERGALNNATAQLRAINATPEDVQARAGRYRQKWPGIDLTAMALVNNWNTVIAAPEKAACQIPQMKSPPHMKQGDYESLDRHGKLSAWDEWGEMWQRRKAAGDVAQAQGEN